VGNESGLLKRNHFLLRRLHSLSGIVPIGLFLISHLLTNSTIAWGMINERGADGVSSGVLEQVGQSTAMRVGTFQHEVGFINNMPFLILIEIALWVSIAFHAILGVYYATSSRPNVQHYAYQDNWRYTLQRVTGYVAILYIFYHIATLRWGWIWLTPTNEPWTDEQATSTLAMALRGQISGISAGGMAVSLFYFVGITACVYHFANGLWTAAISWGLTVTESAQRRWGYICTGFEAAMMLLAWAELIGFLTIDVEDAQQVELSKHAMVADHGAAVEHLAITE